MNLKRFFIGCIAACMLLVQFGFVEADTGFYYPDQMTVSQRGPFIMGLYYLDETRGGVSREDHAYMNVTYEDEKGETYTGIAYCISPTISYPSERDDYIFDKVLDGNLSQNEYGYALKAIMGIDLDAYSIDGLENIIQIGETKAATKEQIEYYIKQFTLWRYLYNNETYGSADFENALKVVKNKDQFIVDYNAGKYVDTYNTVDDEKFQLQLKLIDVLNSVYQDLENNGFAHTSNQPELTFDNTDLTFTFDEETGYYTSNMVEVSQVGDFVSTDISISSDVVYEVSDSNGDFSNQNMPTVNGFKVRIHKTQLKESITSKVSIRITGVTLEERYTIYKPVNGNTQDLGISFWNRTVAMDEVNGELLLESTVPEKPEKPNKPEVPNEPVKPENPSKPNKPEEVVNRPSTGVETSDTSNASFYLMLLFASSVTLLYTKKRVFNKR